jgi:hypothetical protein
VYSVELFTFYPYKSIDRILEEARERHLTKQPAQTARRWTAGCRAPGALEAFRALWVLIFGPQISVRAKAR